MKKFIFLLFFSSQLFAITEFERLQGIYNSPAATLPTSDVLGINLVWKGYLAVGDQKIASVMPVALQDNKVYAMSSDPRPGVDVDEFPSWYLQSLKAAISSIRTAILEVRSDPREGALAFQVFYLSSDGRTGMTFGYFVKTYLLEGKQPALVVKLVCEEPKGCADEQSKLNVAYGSTINMLNYDKRVLVPTLQVSDQRGPRETVPLIIPSDHVPDWARPER